MRDIRQLTRLARDDEAVVRAQTKSHYELFPFISGGDRRERHWWLRVREHLGDVSGRTVVDVGCGAGDLLAALQRHGVHVVGVDITRRAVERTASRGITVAQADALYLPFADRSVDAVTAIGVLHHTPDCRRGLRELARITRPGGRVVVMVYARWTPYQALYLATRLLRGHVDVETLRRMPKPLLVLARFSVWLQVRQGYPDDAIVSLIADQVFTPTATFHRVAEMVRWAAEDEMILLKRTRLPFHGNVLGFQRL